ncbi:MAG: hypothetical protein P0Y52_12200 [Candidatus Brevundimonas phytovorans]|nr:hypothetical protein [Brevundimonas sp.]WEK57298.1 MAG: hypothetical protein P0Y52_12200 [Brevundimonas sp.]
MKIKGATRDRLIMVGAATPTILGFGLGFLFTRDLVQAAAIGGVLCLASAGLSLTPPVTAARMRNLRRKYPKED